MNIVRPPLPNLLPESAPFTPEQRVWLNGFFAGFLSLGDDVTQLTPSESAALMAGTLAPTVLAADDPDDGAPWHDQTIPLAERMKLAESRPLRRRMMAAMGQQDCGQCGYNCEDYSNAIFLTKEERLNLCVPGGKETARMLKTLYAEIGNAPPAVPATVASVKAESIQSRDRPVDVTVAARIRMNKPGSEKETWHVEFDITGSGLEFVVGDSFGVFPKNEPALVDAVIRAIDAPPDFPIAGRSLREVLTDGVSLNPAPDILFQLVSYLTGGERRHKAKALAAGEDPDGDAAALDVLAALEKFPGVRPDPEAFIEALEPLRPRPYTISSSPKTYPGRVSLLVDTVRYQINGRTRFGVASSFLADRVAVGERVKGYVHKAQAFSLPPDPATPIIMIGPGTGVAPFRAFLHERMAMKGAGRNWLFFGHQRSQCDFFYEDELTGMKAAGVLTRLTLAWSRDSGEKIYVQDRMREIGRDLWAWLAEGAHVYVCGDAKRMAKDVERALVDVVAAHGVRSTDQAVAFVTDLKKCGRYQQDVY